MRDSFKYVMIAVVILLCAAGAYSALVFFKREPVKDETVEHRRSVVVVEVHPETVALSVPSQGEIQPVTRTRLTSEVAGRVTEVSPTLKAGVAVSEGDLLLVVDSTSYVSALAQARAALADAKMALVNEQARADQSMRDWKRLGEGGEPTALVLRQPQLESAEARVASAEAGVEKSEIDLQRTRVTAPYDGVIERRMIDVGAFVGVGTPVADLYASGEFEVRLPVSVREARFVASPGKGRTVHADLRPHGASDLAMWTAEVVRSEGMVDQATRSIFLVAELRDDEPVSTNGVRVIPNLFVTAQIEGRSFDSVFRVPRRSLYGANKVLVVDAEDTLRLREVNILWEAANDVVIDKGLVAGERVCLTTFSEVIEGTPVDVTTQAVEVAAE